MQPKKARHILELSKFGLEHLDIPHALSLIEEESDIELIYSAQIAITVAMLVKVERQGAEFGLEDFSFLGEPSNVFEDGSLEYVYYKHPQRDHCIIIDFVNSVFSNAGTSTYGYSVKLIRKHLR